MRISSRARTRVISLFAALLLPAALLVSVPAAQASSSINLGTAANFHLLAGGAITMGDAAVVSGGKTVRMGANQVGQTDLLSARAQLKSLTPATAELELSGKTFTPGVYESPAAWSISSNVVLDGLGDQSSVFVFRNAGAITTAASIDIVLTNGALPKNVFWVTDAAFTTGASSKFAGRVLSVGAATLGASTTLRGQILAGPDAAITLGASATVNGAGVADAFSYSVNFASGSGSGSQAAIVGSATYLQFPQNTFTKAGHDFSGWNTSEDGSGVSFTAGGFYELTQITNLNIFPTWVAVAEPSPTAEPSTSPTPSASPTPTPTVSPTPTPTVSPTPTPTVSPTPTPTVSPKPSASPTPVSAVSPAPTFSPTSEPSVQPTRAEVSVESSTKAPSNPGTSQPTSLQIANSESTFLAVGFEAAAQYQNIGEVLKMFADMASMPVGFVSDGVQLVAGWIAASVRSWNPKYVSAVFDVGIAR